MCSAFEEEVCVCTGLEIELRSITKCVHYILAYSTIRFVILTLTLGVSYAHERRECSNHRARLLCIAEKM